MGVTASVILACLFLGSTVTAQEAESFDIPPVIIDYFYEPGCPDCVRVRNQIMPDLKERFEGFHVLNKYDVGLKTNVVRLGAYQDRLEITDNEPVFMIVDYQYVFSGFNAIKQGLPGDRQDVLDTSHHHGFESIRLKPDTVSHSGQTDKGCQPLPLLVVLPSDTCTCFALR